jgi:hypothetical protein
MRANFRQFIKRKRLGFPCRLKVASFLRLQDIFLVLLALVGLSAPAIACPECYYEKCAFGVCACLPSTGCIPTPASKADYCVKCNDQKQWSDIQEYGDVAVNAKMGLICGGHWSYHSGHCTPREKAGIDSFVSLGDRPFAAGPFSRKVQAYKGESSLFTGHFLEPALTLVTARKPHISKRNRRTTSR